MEYELFLDLIRQFYEYNAVPVWIVDKNEIVFSALNREIVSQNAFSFLKEFSQGRVCVRVFNDIEYFASMPCPIAGEDCTLIAGSYCAHPVNVGFRGRLAAESLIEREKLREYLLSTSPVNKEDFIKYASLLARLTGNEAITADMAEKSQLTLKRELDKKLTELIFTVREKELSPYSPESERRILDMVKAGDVDGAKKINTSFFSDKPGLKISYLYKIVALITLATRAVIEVGVESIDAYGLSDLYLAQLARAKSNKQIAEIAKDVLPHFAELADKRKTDAEKNFSPHLAKAEKYIKTHLHFSLSLKEVADYVGVNDKYLSRLFVTCKNEKFSHYVNRQRINEAKDLLINTDYKLIDIAYSLAFVSESYFIKIFEEICGTTPQKFRNRYK